MKYAYGFWCACSLWLIMASRWYRFNGVTNSNFFSQFTGHVIIYACYVKLIYVSKKKQWPLLLTWFNFNLTMDK